MNRREFTKELIKVFAEKTDCRIQNMNCPCNSCFHNMDENIDFKHICWLILLGLRNDYLKSNEENINLIKEELLK